MEIGDERAERGKDSKVLLPLYRATHRWKDRTQIVALTGISVLPVFAHESERKLEILQTPGVFWLAGMVGRASLIPMTKSNRSARSRRVARVWNRIRI